jgi:outer membrane protein assembly factor BamB
MRAARLAAVLAVIVAIDQTATPTTVRAQGPAYWPGFRGPNASGVSVADERLPVQFSPDSPATVWKAELPEGHSSPAVWGHSLFITGVDRPTNRLAVFSIDRRDGRVQWRREITVTEFEFSHAAGNPASATPATDGERVYAYFGSLGVVAFDFQGTEIWRVPLPVVRMPFGSGTSPIVSGDFVILAREGPDRYLLALDRRTGQRAWQVDLAGCGTGHSTPVIWKDQIVLNRCGQVLAVDRLSGAPLWSLTWGSGSGDTTPAISGDLLFLTAWNNFGEPDLRQPVPTFADARAAWDKDRNGLLSEAELPAGGVTIMTRIDAGSMPGAQWRLEAAQLDFTKDGALDENEWQRLVETLKMAANVDHGLIAIKPGGRGVLPPDTVVWKETRGVAEVPSPLVYRGKVYMVTNGGILSVLRADSGALVYRERLGAPGLYFSSPVATGGRIYIGSGEGVLSVLTDADRLEVLARNDFGEPIVATPALADGHIYVRTARHLYAFGETPRTTP